MSRVFERLERFRVRNENIRRNPKDLQNPFELYNHFEFRRRYRFTKNFVHDVLLPILGPVLLSFNGLQIPVLYQITCALRYYANGSFQLLTGDSLNISQPSVHRIIKKVSEILAGNSHRYIVYPSEEQARIIRQQFYAIAGFPGICGAVDGTHIKICKPAKDDNSEVFRNRKGDFSINTQAICLPNLKFINVVAKWRGSTHDSRIFTNSRVFAQLEEGAIPGNLIGDSGYPLKPYLFTPYLNPRTPQERRYNRAHIRTRNCIERAFGVLKRRFTCLLKPLLTKLDTTLKTIIACFVLHNLGIDANEEPFEEEEVNVEENEEEIDDNAEGQNMPAGRLARERITREYFN